MGCCAALFVEEGVQAKPSGKAPQSQKPASKSALKPAAKTASKQAARKTVAKATQPKAVVSSKPAFKAPLKSSIPASMAKSVAKQPEAKPVMKSDAKSTAPVTPDVHPDAALLAPKTPARSSRGYRPGAVEATKTLAELSDEPIEFKVGDNAVYPGHGVGRVNAIETKEIAGTKLTFYSIQILESGMKIMVPQANVKNVGLRPIISKEEATLVVSILKQTDVKIDNQTWNRRYREYMEKIKTGGVREIAEVLRDLFLLKVDKELSFGERKMLDTARSLLIKELILATGRDELMKEAEVKAILDLS